MSFSPNLFLSNINRSVVVTPLIYACYTQNKELFFDFKSNIPLSDFVYLSLNKNKSYKNLIKIDISNIPIIPMVNKKCWEKLKAMAFKTYVPESNKSRISGAGY